jgi:hypothetical protein
MMWKGKTKYVMMAGMMPLAVGSRDFYPRFLSVRSVAVI